MNEWLLWWPKETRVLLVTPDLHQPLREPVVLGVIRGWQFLCVHVSPSPQQATTVRWILMNVPQTRVWTKEPALTTLVATPATVLCLTQVSTAGQQARVGVCPVRGSASTASQWLGSEMPLWGLSAWWLLVSQALQKHGGSETAYFMYAFLCLWVFIYLVLWCWESIPRPYVC